MWRFETCRHGPWQSQTSKFKIWIFHLSFFQSQLCSKITDYFSDPMWVLFCRVLYPGLSGKCNALDQWHTFGWSNYPMWLGLRFYWYFIHFKKIRKSVLIRGPPIWTGKDRRPSPWRVPNRLWSGPWWLWKAKWG